MIRQAQAMYFKKLSNGFIIPNDVCSCCSSTCTGPRIFQYVISQQAKGITHRLLYVRNIQSWLHCHKIWPNKHDHSHGSLARWYSIVKLFLRNALSNDGQKIMVHNKIQKTVEFHLLWIEHRRVLWEPQLNHSSGVIGITNSLLFAW